MNFVHVFCDCKQCQELEEKARKWDKFEHSTIRKIVSEHIENENQKLRELIEKRIEEIEPYTDISNPEFNDLMLEKELQKLLEESKK